MLILAEFTIQSSPFLGPGFYILRFTFIASRIYEYETFIRELMGEELNVANEKDYSEGVQTEMCISLH